MSARRDATAAVLALALAFCAPLPASAASQDDAAEASDEAGDAAPPGTGDAWIDRRLDDMDGYAARYRDAFIDEIARYQEAPRELLVETLDAGMRPGDVYYACALASAAGRSCRGVIDAWRASAGGGWPAVAEGLGLAPADGLHARIRDDIDASYRRWARPHAHLDKPKP